MPEGGVGPTVAIIPARGGSKRIPRKNVKPFLGVPLLARTVAILTEAGIFDRIVVSTDDEEVAEVAQHAGAEVPFLRPAELADDYTPTVPVVADAIERLGDRDVGREVCCIYPTAVLLQAHSLVQARSILSCQDIDYVVPVATFPSPIQRALRIDDDGLCAMLEPENIAARSQDLEPTYHDAGQFYWGTREAWTAQRPIFGPRTRALVLPSTEVQDIDTEDDWALAEQRYRLLQGGSAE